MSLRDRIIAAAREYIAAALPVFPVNRAKKSPLTPHGHKDATLDLHAVEAWWLQHPDANLAIAVPAGWVVLDVDPGGMGAIQANDYSLPSTLTAKTSRGYHYWFRVPDEFTGKLGPKVAVLDGVDTRALGGYVVSPPSKHASGNDYEWVGGFDINKACEAPDWVLDVGTVGAANVQQAEGIFAPAPIDGDQILLHGIPKGQQDWGLFRYACSLRHRNFSRMEALTLVTTVAEKCDYHEASSWARKKVDSAWKYNPGAPVVDASGRRPIKIWELGELLAADLPEPQWIVDKLLPEGLCLVVSPPKGGKSMLLGNICWAYAEGGTALGCYPANQGGVLYLDLEQGEVMGRKRWQRLLGGQPHPRGLHIAYEWDRMGQGGVERMREFLTEHPTVRLVVIDILSCFWPDDTDKTKGLNAYHKEYRVLSELGAFAKEFGICLTLVHHTNRQRADDPLAMVSGTNAMTGAMDTIWMLKRERNSRDGELHVTGKNIAEEVIALDYMPEVGGWIAKPEERIRVMSEFEKVPL